MQRNRIIALLLAFVFVLFGIIAVAQSPKRIAGEGTGSGSGSGAGSGEGTGTGETQ